MQLSELDKKIINVIHGLPLEEQQSILNFGLGLKNKMKMKKMVQPKKASFSASLKEFLKEVEDDPIDIDTSIFDDYRKTVTERFNAPQKPKLLKRQAGLGRGTVWMSDDFDDELPDSFWLGEDE